MNDATARELTDAIKKLSQLTEKQLQQREDMQRRWRHENPELSKRCRQASKVFNKVYGELLEEILEAAEDPEVSLNTFTMHEFLDKFGPKLVYSQNMIQLFTQLGS